MNKIKFRIFNKKTKQMEEIISFDKARNLINDKPLYNFVNSKHEKLSELMQFTGFTDSKNKEIYEGDIIAIKEYTKHPMIYEVQFDKETASFVLVDFITNTKVHIESSDNIKKSIVVDNIYEKLKIL